MPELALPIVMLSALVLIVWETVAPAHIGPSVGRSHWYLRAVVMTAINMGVFMGVDGLLVKFASNFSLLHLASEMSPFAGALLAYFVFTFLVYWWHRARHHFNFLWQWFHQLHHSPQRIETLTAYYIHPLDMAANLLISNTIVFLMLGLGLEAAGWYTVLTGIAGFVIHANIRFPRIVGYVFQTPEMHRYHHKANQHSHNYSDVVWWDMLFGTYHNPTDDVAHCGFMRAAEEQCLPMLVGKLVNTEFHATESANDQ